MAELKLGGHMKLLSLLKAGVISLMAGMATVHAGDSTTLGTSAALPMNLPIATEGTACSAKGLTAFSNTGLLLTCQSGVWKGSGGNPTTITAAGPAISQGFSTVTCPASHPVVLNCGYKLDAHWGANYLIESSYTDGSTCTAASNIISNSYHRTFHAIALCAAF